MMKTNWSSTWIRIHQSPSSEMVLRGCEGLFYSKTVDTWGERKETIPSRTHARMHMNLHVCIHTHKVVCIYELGVVCVLTHVQRALYIQLFHHT